MVRRFLDCSGRCLGTLWTRFLRCRVSSMTAGAWRRVRPITAFSLTLNFCLLSAIVASRSGGEIFFGQVSASTPAQSGAKRVAPQGTPQPQWVTPAFVKEVKDGDTVTVEIRREVTVRFLDCWCPESRKDPRVPAAKQESEKARGIAAKNNLAGMLKTGTEVVLQIPTSGEGDIAEVMTMGRILGYVWPKNGMKSFSQLQVEAGHATVNKPEYLK